MITGMKQSFYRNYSGILPQRHQGTKIIELCFIIAFLMRLRRINAKSPLFNLYSSSLWVPGPDPWPRPGFERVGLYLWIP